jgi:Protein of unknown function (DUF3102)
MVVTCRSAKTEKSDDRKPSPPRRRASDKSRVQAPAGRASQEAAQPERIPIANAAVVPRDVLEDLAVQIKAKQDQHVGGLRRSLTLAIELGGLLLQVKKQLPHGSFQRWIQDNCDFSYESAAAYTRLHERGERLGQINSKMQSIADLTVSEALHVLAKPRAKADAGKVNNKPDRRSAPACSAAEKVAQASIVDSSARGALAADPKSKEHEREGETSFVSSHPSARNPSPANSPRWPGVTSADEQSELDAMQESFKKALVLIRATFRNGLDDLGRANRLWLAFDDLRFHLFELLLQATPQALLECEVCRGSGDRLGLLCPQCFGTGVAIDQGAKEGDRVTSDNT